MIQAFHSNWTRPLLDLGREYYIEDFEILTTILSALKWREKNGSIKMITDSIAGEYYKKIGIDSIWDLGIDLSLDSINDNIDSSIFWAAGKIYALRDTKSPIVMIDTDFIVWESVEDILNKYEVCTIHTEDINEQVYPDIRYFNMKNGYSFDNEWSLEVLPCNTAFTYIANENFKRYYTKSSIDFMKNLEFGYDRVSNMVFAEQRLISMCAYKMKIDIKEIMSLDKLFEEKQNIFTHIWGYKEMMRKDYNKRKEFCIRCINRIITDFPQYEEIISNIESLGLYYREWKIKNR